MPREEVTLLYWIVMGVIVLAAIAAYVVTYLYARRRQKTFDAQYNAAKERHEVFVLSKKTARERPNTRLGRFMKVKTYQVVGRVSVSQAVRGMQMSRMQTVTFQTMQREYDKIQVNHKYKMDIAGNYIGYVLASQPAGKGKGKGQAQVKGKGKGKANPVSKKRSFLASVLSRKKNRDGS